MLGLAEKVFQFLLRVTGVLFLHISGMLEMQMMDELKSCLPMFMLQDAQYYAGYLPLIYFVTMVGNYSYQTVSF